MRSEKHELTMGERAADAMRNGMGSWAFVFGAMVFLGAWMVYNGHHGFDAYPFILLNLILSCLAAMQGAILLIAAKRADQISAELAQHDYQTNLDAKAILEALHALVLERLPSRELAIALLQVETAGLRGADAIQELGDALRNANPEG